MIRSAGGGGPGGGGRVFIFGVSSPLPVSRGTDGTIIHHDQDTVYTSYDWRQTPDAPHPGPGAGLPALPAGRQAFYTERGARDNPWIESLWGHFKVENGSLLSEAATLEELEWVIERQMRYYNTERRHSGLGYRAPVVYPEAGIHPRVLVEIGPPSGSVSGAQVHARAKTGLWRLWYKTAAAQRVGVPNA